jgi:hypothetical protein
MNGEWVEDPVLDPRMRRRKAGAEGAAEGANR